MNLVIVRDMKPYQYGTFGRLYVNGKLKGLTVEQEYKSNTPFESCIPDGDYDLIKYDSPKYGTTYAAVNPDLNVYTFERDMEDDTGRYACLFFHKGSYPSNFQGCCGVGKRLHIDGNGDLFLSNTTDTVERVLRELLYDGSRHKLSIMSVEPNLWRRHD